MFWMSLYGALVLLVASSEAGKFYDVNGTSYYVSYPTLKNNWYQAQRFCILHGMHMATIHTELQYDKILEVLEKHKITSSGVHFWTSGTDLGVTNREYYWAASGFPLTFANWHGGCPRTSVTSKLCILINGDSSTRFQFYDHDCDSTQYVLCQSRLELPEMLKQQHCQL